MLVGDKVLQVTDRRQLTLSADGKVVEVDISPDGRYVVYLIADNRGESNLYECRLVKVLTGKTATIMSRIPTDEPRESSRETWTLDEAPGIAWSPDSSLFALEATHVAWEAGQRSQQQVMVYSASGAFRKALPLGPPSENAGQTIVQVKLHFTPDSHGLVASLLTSKLDSSKAWEYYSAITLFDLGTGSSRDVTTSKLDYEPKSWGLLPAPSIVGWSADGALLVAYWGAHPEMRLTRKRPSRCC